MVKNLILVIGWIISLSEASLPSVQQGVLDLRQWNWHEDIVQLDGEWKFFWNHLLIDSTGKEKNYSLESIPSSWHQYQDAQNGYYPAFGCATYSLTILLPEHKPSLALRIPSMANASKIFIGDDLIGEEGKVSCQKDLMIPHVNERVYVIPADSSQIHLTMQISNFQTSLGGPIRSPRLGTESNLVAQFEFWRSIRILFAGMLFLMGVYHLILWLYNMSQRSNLWFSFLSLVGSHRLVSPGDHMLGELFSFLSWSSTVRVNFAAIGIGFAGILLFMSDVYALYIHKRWIPYLIGAAFFYVLSCFALPTYWLYPSLSYAQIIWFIGMVIVFKGLWRAIHYETGWAPKAHFVAMIIFVLTVINDFMHAHQMIDTTYLASFGLISVVIVQWFLIARDYSLTYTNAEHRLEKFMTSIAQAIISKNQYTGEHVTRVARVADALAREINLPAEKVHQIRLGAIVHDVGKIHLSDDLLNKEEELTEEERQLIQDHPEHGYQILSKVEGIEIPLNVIRYHHEHYDGSGYPRGLKGDEIPIEARIVAIADTWDAITSPRAYREAYSRVEALTILLQEAQTSLNQRNEKVGPNLDPVLVEIFAKRSLWKILDQPSEQDSEMV